MMLKCKTCCHFEDKQDKPGLVCVKCNDFFHLTCLWSTSTGVPGDLAGDAFFIFTCSSCSKEGREKFVRCKMTWLNIIYLTLYNLNSQSVNISNHGYFHYKTHIINFIDRNWDVLFEPKFKQKKNWIGTIAGVLSIYSNVLFRSGSSSLGESGWWKLQHNFSPVVAAHIIQEISQDKVKFKANKGTASTLDPSLFVDKVIEMGYARLLLEYNAESELTIAPAPSKKRRLELDDYSDSNTPAFDYADSDSRFENNEEALQDFSLSSSLQLTGRDPADSDAETSYAAYEYSSSNIMAPIESETSLQSFQALVNYESDNNTFYTTNTAIDHTSDDNEYEHKKVKSEDQKPKKKEEDKPVPIRRVTLFSKELNSIDMPWLPERTKEVEDNVNDKVSDNNKVNDSKIVEKVKKPAELVELSEYEEVHLLKQVEALIPKVCDVSKKAELRMLKAKLALRRLKRHKHLPVFDLEKTVKVLAGYMVEDEKVVSNVERVLDRFQRSYLMDSLCGTVASTNYGMLLVSRNEPATFQSPYSGAVLKPFIRRDLSSTPLWCKLMDELLRKTNSTTADYVPPKRAPVDYSYVRPQHVAAVNSLCALHFWPGIDLTEALQYPEYSCVVTYKKLVIACAFLVPDAGSHEAYISFVLTRPEWRNAGIATFMIYHLLQTCTGKDVTLHVSPTNPAIFLYQKFGFKVEEFIQDFYEKYYDIDYKGCRHALFLRLVR